MSSSMARGLLSDRARVEAGDQPVDLLERVVVDHRDPHDAVAVGEAEMLDQPARMEVAEADADPVGVDRAHDRRADRGPRP